MSPSHRAAALAFAIIALVAGARDAAAERVTSYAFIRSDESGQAGSRFTHGDHKCYVNAWLPVHPLDYEPSPYDMLVLYGASIIHAVVYTDNCYEGERTWQPVEYDPKHPTKLDIDWTVPHDIIQVILCVVIGVLLVGGIVSNQLRKRRIRHPRRA